MKEGGEIRWDGGGGGGRGGVTERDGEFILIFNFNETVKEIAQVRATRMAFDTDV